MSEVKPYTPSMKVGHMVKDVDGLWIRLKDYETAQSELTALREDLATAKRNEHNSEVAYKAAIERQDELREDLAAIINNRNELKERLTAAEQRNAALIAALTYLRDTSDDSHVFEKAQDALNENICSSCVGSKQERVLGRDNSEFVIDCSICTQPTELGASE